MIHVSTHESCNFTLIFEFVRMATSKVVASLIAVKKGVKVEKQQQTQGEELADLLAAEPVVGMVTQKVPVAGGLRQDL
jgi:hypothetical protein